MSKTRSIDSNTIPPRRQDQPCPHTPPEYGEKVQYAKGADDSPLLSKADKKKLQQVTGLFLLYSIAVDSTMVTVLSAIAPEQATPTENTMKKCNFWIMQPRRKRQY